ncbi:MAG: DUF2993 domain-containing protein [Armatimonadota bacterium]|nr:DUF2993 domain-containing protein [Armatimonadota bacterium]
MKTVILSLAALGLAGAAILESSWTRIERAAAADLAGSLGVSVDNVSVRAAPDGLVGSMMGRVDEVVIEAHGFSVDGMPLFCEPGLSTAGRLGLLKLSLSDFVIRDLPVKRLETAIPRNRFALGLLQKGVVRLSRSGEGVGTVTLDEAGLAKYMLARFDMLEAVDVRLEKYKVFVAGRASFGFVRRSFEVIADLEIAGKRQLVIAKPIVFIEGRRIRDGSEVALANAFNPVLDIDRDLGLAGAFDMQALVIRDGTVTISGAARIPNRPTQPTSP